MHERYFYMTSALSAAFACRRGGRAVFAALLIELAMLSTYWALSVSLAQASLMMLCALALLLTLRNGDCRKG